MKKTIKTIRNIILGIAFLGAMLLAGGIDNEYNEQKSTTKPCREVSISQTATICQ